MNIKHFNDYLLPVKHKKADTSLRFGKFFRNSADFWLGIQVEYDLRKEKAEIECVLEEIKEYK